VSIETVGVAGLGLLGRGIAACFLSHGFRVIGFTRSESTHAEARRYITQAIGELIEHAGFAPELADEWADRYLPVASCDKMGECDLVIESVIENADAKRKVFDQIESVVRPQVPIASNTSALPISLLQSDRKHPERFLGMHWAEPAHMTRFMELIRGEQTADEPFEAVAQMAGRIGKEASLVQKDVPAFVINRIGYAMYREALHILESGIADVETIDRSCRNALGLWATMCGPFRWIDLTGGPALYCKAIEGVLPSLNNSTELPETLKKLRDQDARGIANGRGFYEYTDEEAAQWEALFLKHAWNVRKLVDEYFPIEKPCD
jgi:3-hydroxybutyryl-CoA dehydrogenase